VRRQAGEVADRIRRAMTSQRGFHEALCDQVRIPAVRRGRM
jgi:hypothetical protein